MTDPQKPTEAVIEYFYAWDAVRALRSKLRSMRCEFYDQGGQYTSGTDKCFHADDVLDKTEEWCESCRKGKQIVEELKILTKRMRQKLNVVRRIGRKLA